MPYTFAKSKEMYDRASRVIAEGVNSGIRKLEQPVPLFFTHGKGSRLWDEDGNEYIDFLTGQEALLYGHAPEGLKKFVVARWNDPGPLEIDVRLERLSDGMFELEDAQSHLASISGRRIEMGPTAVVAHGHVTILVTSQATPPFDLGQWRSQGVNPELLEIIGVKAAVGHRRG